MGYGRSPTEDAETIEGGAEGMSLKGMSSGDKFVPVVDRYVPGFNPMLGEMREIEFSLTPANGATESPSML